MPTFVLSILSSGFSLFCFVSLREKFLVLHDQVNVADAKHVNTETHSTRMEVSYIVADAKHRNTETHSTRM